MVLSSISPAVLASTGWGKIYEGDGYDALIPYSVIQTSDGGYAIAAYADTKKVVEDPYWRLVEEWQFWLIKTDSSGLVQWKQVWGNVSGEVFIVVQAPDGGYAIGGTTSANPNQVYGNQWWLIKTDSLGKTQWNKTYPFSEDEQSDTFGFVYSMILTKDSGYALAGYANVLGTGNTGDFCLLKTDSAGNVQWKKTYDGGTYQEPGGAVVNTQDLAYSLVQTSDGGYALGGESLGYDTSNFFLVKTDSSGNRVWDTKYWEPYLQGGLHFRGLTHKAIQTSDGGYALIGSEEKSFEDNDFYLIKVDSSGSVQWRKTYGDKYADVPSSVVQLGDGGFALGGTMREVVKSYPDTKNLAIVRTDSSGNPLWTKLYNAKVNETLGGQKSEDYGYCMVRTKDGAYVIAGTTVNGWDGSHVDIFVVKSETLESPIEPTQSLSMGEVTGQVNVQAPGQGTWAPATSGAILTEGTKAKTAEASGASFVLGETAKLQMSSSTLIEILSSAGNSHRLQLNQGELTATVNDLPVGDTFVVETSQAVATVKGTKITLSETGAESVLTVQEGVVTFVSKVSGASVDVSAGHTVSATGAGLSGVEQQEFPYFTIVAIAAISVVVLAGIILFALRRKKKNETLPTTSND
jgi:hypothetical protein